MDSNRANPLRPNFCKFLAKLSEKTLFYLNFFFLRRGGSRAFLPLLRVKKGLKNSGFRTYYSRIFLLLKSIIIGCLSEEKTEPSNFSVFSGFQKKNIIILQNKRSFSDLTLSIFNVKLLNDILILYFCNFKLFLNITLNNPRKKMFEGFWGFLRVLFEWKKKESSQ